MMKFDQLAQITARIKTEIAKLGGITIKKRMLMAARWSTENYLADHENEIIQSFEQEISAEIFQTAFWKARHVRPIAVVNFWPNHDKADELRNHIFHHAAKMREPIIVVSPAMMTALQSRNLVERLSTHERSQVPIVAMMGKYPVAIDQYANDDIPVMILDKGWVAFREDDNLELGDTRYDARYYSVTSSMIPYIDVSKIVIIDYGQCLRMG